jgi:succinate dehydrogenase/fumarate reductase flavoprotein subunit
MTQVWGPRAGKSAARFASSEGRGEADPRQVKELAEKILAPLKRPSGSNPIEIRNQVRHLCHLYLNSVREGHYLEKVLEELKGLWEAARVVRVRHPEIKKYNMEWLEALQTENLLTIMEMVTRASLMRTESRGAMFRRDFQNTDGVNWLKNIVISRKGEELNLRTEPVVVTTLEPPRMVYPYTQPPESWPMAEKRASVEAL